MERQRRKGRKTYVERERKQKKVRKKSKRVMAVQRERRRGRIKVLQCVDVCLQMCITVREGERA